MRKIRCDICGEEKEDDVIFTKEGVICEDCYFGKDAEPVKVE